MCHRLLAIGLLALAASGEVRISGRVTSDTFAPVANAIVILSTKTGERYRALTDPAGAFALEVRERGEVQASVERDGFFALKNQTVFAGAGDLEFVLSPIREMSELVDVTSGSSSIALDQASSETRLTGANLLDVPYPTTQNFKAAMRIVPGVVQDAAGGVHVNGGSENQVLYLMDGFNIADPLTGTLQSRVSVESVQSMSVMSGLFSAEYGKGSAGVLSVNTKLGDNRLRYSATNFIPGIENSSGWHINNWTPRVNLSGPLLAGRAWFSDSLTSQYNQTVVPELPKDSNASSSWRWSNLLRTQVNLSPGNILYAGFLFNDYTAARTGLTALDPIQTTVDRRSRQWFFDIKDQMYLPGRAVLEFGYASNHTFARQIPQGHDLYVTTPEGHQGNYFVNGTQTASRDQFLVNGILPAFRFAGEHQIKAGTDFDRLTYDQDLDRTGMEFYSVSSLVRRVTYLGSGRLWKNNLEASAYIQDSWRARKNVLVEVGLRSDWDNLLRNWNTSPRIGVAWSPFGLENTKLSAGYAVTYDATNLQLFTRALDQVPEVTYFPPYGNGVVTTRQFFMTPAGHYASPRFSNWSVALDQRLAGNVYLKLQGIRRRGSQGLTYVGSPSTGDTFFDLTNARTDSYSSAEITVRQNLRKQYEWLVSYTRSHAASSSVIDFSADQPLMAGSTRGRMPWDAPNRILGWGYLPTFWENYAIAFLAEYRTGFPFSAQNDAGYIVGDVNSRRYPDFFELNLHVERKLRFHGQLWAVRAGMNNITNHLNPNAVISDVNSDRYLSFFGGQTRATVFRIRWLGKL